MEENELNWIVTKSKTKISFEDIGKNPSEGGPISRLKISSLVVALQIFTSYCKSLDKGCIQVFDASSKTEHISFAL